MEFEFIIILLRKSKLQKIWRNYAYSYILFPNEMSVSNYSSASYDKSNITKKIFTCAGITC